MPLDHEIQTLRALLDSGERDGCARALADLRDRYRLQPTAFDPRAIQALRDIAEALNRNEEDRPLAKLALRPPRAPPQPAWAKPSHAVCLVPRNARPAAIRADCAPARNPQSRSWSGFRRMGSAADRREPVWDNGPNTSMECEGPPPADPDRGGPGKGAQVATLLKKKSGKP